MTTESTTTLASMLDAEEPVQTSAPAPAEAVSETGDNQSAAPPADADAPAPQADVAPHVPLRALEDERKKRQELERRLADLERSVRPPQQQQPQAQPQPQITQEDLERLWWENPAQAAAIVQHIAAQNAVVHAERVVMSRELDRSERRARKAHGDEVVTEALERAREVGMIQKFLQEDDPYEALIEWHREIEVVRNPASAREKIRAELMAEMGLAPAANPKPAASAPVPKSLASRASAVPRNERGQFAGRASLDDLLG